MPTRRLSVRPTRAQLADEVNALRIAHGEGDPAAIAAFVAAGHAAPRDVLAMQYGAPNWARLVLCCDLVDAIWKDDAAALQKLLAANPALLHEPVLLRADSNWGPPMTYAANLGRDGLITLLHGMGATDLESAFARAVLQGQVGTARMLHELRGAPALSADLLGGPAYTLNVAGTELLFELGVQAVDAKGRSLAPVATVLETDSRQPEAKHRILELYAAQGVPLPDTAPMAVHRGRADLLAKHLKKDKKLLKKTFSHDEIFPAALGCHDEVLATHGTPLAGATLLHMCVDYDELALAEWLLAQGMAVDVRAAVDADGFGGHTALFATVVSQPAFWMNHGDRAPDAAMAELLLRHGADREVRASLRKQLHPGYDNTDHALHEYRDVTPVEWGERFHDQRFVNRAALDLLRESAVGAR